MNVTRENHYVPEWYQKGFWEPGRNTLAYLSLAPPAYTRADGTKVYGRALHSAPPSRAFKQWDLYSTFFGTSVDDEIERKLFGDIDTRGAKAVRAFAAGDPSECHRNFNSLFEYIDAQKLRTPKGLAWLRAQYPSLSQNELMMEMQSIRMMHCTVWTECVREIVSARSSDVKFITSDHPVTVYNPATPPGSAPCKYPSDPGIELKGTQTVFPLDRDHCLILTNLEFAENPKVGPLEKRTFPRRFRNSMVRTDAFIRTRELSNDEVHDINRIIRSRSHQHVAAGREEWLVEPVTNKRDWAKLGAVLLPPAAELFRFGGEMYVRYESGEVHYQDAFGRTEKEREFLKKPLIAGRLRAAHPCGCGSAKTFADCCKSKPTHLRPSWSEMSIHERNLTLYNGIEEILGLSADRDWADIRRAITDDKISKIYSIYEALWPLETDLLSLLPKPDGAGRAVYTGVLHPAKIIEMGLGSSLLFGEVLMQHPFVNPRVLREKYNPVKNPAVYRQEFLKTVLLFIQAMPLVEMGLINLFPDPWEFDFHLRDQSMLLAKERASLLEPIMKDDSEMKALAEEEVKRGFYLLSEDGQRAHFKRMSPELSEKDVAEMLTAIKLVQEQDPLAVLQEETLPEGEDGGQLSTFKLAPNFEVAMYVAQATGSSIITDHSLRWKEILLTSLVRGSEPVHHLSEIAKFIQSSSFPLPQHSGEIALWAAQGRSQPLADVFSDMFRYLRRVDASGVKPNYEQGLRARLKQARSKFETAIRKSELMHREARVTCAFPNGGIYDSTITRLLLMSSSEHHLPNVPMAFFFNMIDE